MVKSDELTAAAAMHSLLLFAIENVPQFTEYMNRNRKQAPVSETEMIIRLTNLHIAVDKAMLQYK